MLPTVVFVSHDVAGGIGDDTYMINSANDVIVEQPGEGTDTALIFVNNMIDLT